MMSLRAKITTGIAMILAYGVMIIYLALSLPASKFEFHAVGEQLFASRDGAEGQAVSEFLIGSRILPATPQLVIEEPDVLPTYEQLNTLYSQHQQLHDAVIGEALSLRLSDGNVWPVIALERGIGMLPVLFWVQLICGLLGTLICLLVWIPGERNLATHSFALTGIGYLLASSTAAIYSTRALFIPGDLFQLLSAVNHAGAMLFSSAVSVFLWNYPRKIAPFWLSALLYAGFFVCVILDQTQAPNSSVLGFHLWVLGVFIVGLTGAAQQWRKTRMRPADRSAFRWVLLSIIAGTFFFSAGMILPAILQIAQPSTQAPLLATFLLMYAGMALGVTRYRLFELERWWFSIWTWLLGGLAVLLTDLLLASMLALSGPETLAISLALVGWCYFPIRQLVWGMLFAPRRNDLDTWLAKALPAMLQARQKSDSDVSVMESLDAVFQPLTLDKRMSPAERAIVQENGEALLVPDPAADKSYLLRHADKGARLFTRQDVKQAKLILALDSLVRQSFTARLEGATEERNRIRQDIHDDLGAKLLQLLHTAPADSTQLVRDAIRDLRELLQNMDGQPIALEAAASNWREEAEQRCRPLGISLHWQEQVSDHVLSAEQFSHLTRLLREAVSNALKHARPNNLSVRLTQQDLSLQLHVENDGLTQHQQPLRGRGLAIMTSRARQLQGELTHQHDAAHWRITVRVPLDDKFAT